MIELPKEFLEALDAVHRFGVTKYGADVNEFNWLEPNAPKTDHESMLNSIFHHIAETWSKTWGDHESNLPPEWHAAYRLMMYITRKERDIEHEKDL